MGYNCFGGLGLVEKAVYFLNSKKFKKGVWSHVTTFA